MAGYSFLLIYSGFSYDTGSGTIGFAPLHRPEKDRASYFWSLGTSWGTLEYTNHRLTLSVLGGNLKLHRFIWYQTELYHGEAVNLDEGEEICFQDR